MSSPRFGRTLRIALVGLWVALLAGLVVPQSAQAAGLCYPQRAAFSQVQAAIAAHNARNHLFQPGEEAELAAFNAEAVQLNAAREQTGKALQSCLKAEGLLAGPSTKPENFRIQVTASFERRLVAATRQVPPGYQPTRWVPGQGPAEVPQELRQIYDRLRPVSPPRRYANAPLQGRNPPRVGNVDPAFPGATIQASKTGAALVRSDHILPLAAIIRLPGFTKLNPRNMYAVVNSPANLQWLSQRANAAKSSSSMANVMGVDPAFARVQAALEQQAERRLLRAIDLLLQSQRPH